MRFPERLEAGQRLDTPAMLIDAAPTVLNLLRVPMPVDSFQGKDLFRLPENEPRKRYSLDSV